MNIISENKNLNDTIVDLTIENNELKIKLQRLQDTIQHKICNYFNKCHSLKQTTEHFYFESIRYCYHSLVEYFRGADHIIRTAVDYETYYNDIFCIKKI